MSGSGGILNLIAQGSNNIFLTGNPSKQFFKKTYVKHTDFGLQKFRIDYDGLRTLRLSEPSVFRFKFPRNADLLMDTYFAITLPDIWSPIYNPCEETNFNWSAYEYRWIKDIGLQMITEIEITCGSSTIQKYSGAYLSAMIQRDFNADKKDLYNRMSGNTPEFNDPANAFGRANSYPSAYYTSNVAGAEPSIRSKTLYIPLNTWFTLNSSCAFPLIALQYNELYINITVRPIQELFQVRDIFDVANNYPYIQPDFNQQQFQMYRFLQTPPSVSTTPENYQNQISNWNADIHLISTYAFLQKEESKWFAANDQVYLIKDIFTYNYYNISGTNKVQLLSNGMIANWMFYFQRNDVNMRNEWNNYTNWPYDNLPNDIQPAPQTDVNSPFFNENQINLGPLINVNGDNTGYFISGDFNTDNVKDILQTLAIVLDGSYRENTQSRGIYDYIEKYTRTPGSAVDGIYCYNFCLDTSPFQYSPSGAINLSKFRNIEFEFSTYLPTIDTAANNQFSVICDSSGNTIGIYKQNWRLFDYTFNLTIHEERYNVLSFISGNAGLLYAR
jgi:hypothetical protein